MKPLDPKLLSHASPARRYVLLVTLTGFLSAALIIAQCFLISYAISPAIGGRAGLEDALPYVGMLALVVLGRILVTWVQESFGHRAALATIATLRENVLTRAGALGPRWLASRTSSIATFAIRGLEDLEPYFVKYLPQLLLTATVTPASLLVVLLLDWPSALIVVFCIPIIPIFMILIGKMTESTSQRKLAAMESLGGQVLDLLAGLPTLKALGREQGPKKRINDLGESYTKTTMESLRIAFLSGSVLEFLATLSTALVAVEVGFRMVYGHLDLTTGLIIIMLTPEIFKPLREVGSQYHASTDGLAAAEQAIEIIETPVSEPGKTPAPPVPTSPIKLLDVSVEAEGRGVLAPANLSATIEPGLITALAGPSGAGKSTAVSLILGLHTPTTGTVTVGGADLSTIDPASWWSQISWVPQRPVIVPGTVADNVGSQDSAAAELTGFDEVLADLPSGWDTVIGQGGVGLSLGQRQRLALTRAFTEDRPLLVLDEPTAHLDAVSESRILATVQAAKERGQTVLVIAHRDSLLKIADRVIHVTSKELVS
ncbi:thiol reductant ABC exporter subunit CydD [Flaviflexus massiliensis]|uniref:thiol reductant ABC exporter subunit CydD n=1 Tax=Flaviflexus massiliensis TaxID=1522309 RepID=UPI0006D56C08|nr:thiol reductant ABC exporter subunit CydD [Flaviflexus massiliensis]